MNIENKVYFPLEEIDDNLESENKYSSFEQSSDISLDKNVEEKVEEIKVEKPGMSSKQTKALYKLIHTQKENLLIAASFGDRQQIRMSYNRFLGELLSKLERHVGSEWANSLEQNQLNKISKRNYDL